MGWASALLALAGVGIKAGSAAGQAATRTDPEAADSRDSILSYNNPMFNQNANLASLMGQSRLGMFDRDVVEQASPMNRLMNSVQQVPTAQGSKGPAQLIMKDLVEFSGRYANGGVVRVSDLPAEIQEALKSDWGRSIVPGYAPKYLDPAISENYTDILNQMNRPFDVSEEMYLQMKRDLEAKLLRETGKKTIEGPDDWHPEVTLTPAQLQEALINGRTPHGVDSGDIANTLQQAISNAGFASVEDAVNSEARFQEEVIPQLEHFENLAGLSREAIGTAAFSRNELMGASNDFLSQVLASGIGDQISGADPVTDLDSIREDEKERYLRDIGFFADERRQDELRRANASFVNPGRQLTDLNRMQVNAEMDADTDALSRAIQLVTGRQGTLQNQQNMILGHQGMFSNQGSLLNALDPSTAAFGQMINLGSQGTPTGNQLFNPSITPGKNALADSIGTIGDAGSDLLGAAFG